jgi:hypothetical protein
MHLKSDLPLAHAEPADMAALVKWTNGAYYSAYAELRSPNPATFYVAGPGATRDEAYAATESARAEFDTAVGGFGCELLALEAN